MIASMKVVFMSKYCRLIVGLLGFVSVLNSGSSVSSAPDTVADLNATQSLLKTYCVSCHSATKPKGDLSLDQLSGQPWSDYDLFDDLVARVEDGDMPPAKADKPLEAGDRAKLLAALKQRLATLDQAQVPGEYKKLTAQEYSNTLVDVFGFPVRKLSDLPFDSDHEVKRIGEHQVITSYAVKKYYAVAHKYLDEHLIHNKMEPSETTYTAASGKDLTGRQYVTTHGALAGGGNSPIFILRNPVTTFAEEGEYELEFDWFCFYGDKKDRTGKGKTHVKPINTPQISYHAGRTNSEVLNAVKTIESGRQYLCSMDKPIRIVLRKDMKFLSFRGPDNQFKAFDKTDPRYLKVLNGDLPKDKKRSALKAIGAELMKELHGDKAMFLLVTGATFRGPLNKPETPFNKRLFGQIQRTDSIEKCLPIIKKVAGRLFRRPVSEAMLQSYYDIARKEYAESKNSYQATKATLNALLCSPHFVFKYEGARESLDDYMIASRLSYFLWNSAPDAELLDLAAKGKLKDPAVRREQALRLLGDREKSDRFSRTFTNQWLGLDRFGTYTPNEAYLDARRFNPVKDYLEYEPTAFFNELLHSNLSAVNFIHSDFVVWNHPIASHYGRGTPGLKFRSPFNTKGVDRNEFQRIDLQENPNQTRGGLMTMASIMSLTTDGENTQPILRGVWIAKRMFGLEIEAPASVPAIEVNLGNVSKPREILAKHKTDASCYACHVKFDHFGLAMEHYDVVGFWRKDYVHPVQNEKGRFELVKKDPIDAKAETPDGQAMHGAQGVKNYLLAHKDVFMQNLIERLYSYALGRKVRYRDREVIQSLLKGMKADDYKLRDTILNLIEAEEFVNR